MVNILGTDGHIRSVRGPTKRQQYVFTLIAGNTVSFVTGKTDDVLCLADIKNKLKSLKDNPFKMHLEKRHANPQIQSDCVRLVKLKLIDAKEFGGRVIYFSDAKAKSTLSETKDPKQKEAVQKRYEMLTSLPNRDTYYD